MGAAAATGVGAAAATGVGAATTSAVAAATTSAVAASRRKSYALAEARIALPIENVKGRQTDVCDFLLAEKNPTCIVLRRYVRWRVR